VILKLNGVQFNKFIGNEFKIQNNQNIGKCSFKIKLEYTIQGTIKDLDNQTIYLWK
jgi:hypothetical protein